MCRLLPLAACVLALVLIAPAAAESRTYVLCANAKATERHQEFRPRRCNTLGPTEPWAAPGHHPPPHGGAGGGGPGPARGGRLGFHRPASRVRVTVYAYRRRAGCDGDRVYTRLRVTSRYGRVVVRQPTDCP